MKVCAIAAQPGHTKDLQSVQLERGLRIVDSSGVIFDDDDHIQGQKESSVLLRNIVKSEDRFLYVLLRDLDSRPLLVEEILARTQTERLMKIYDLPTPSSTLEFLTMLALSTGRLLRVSSPCFLSFKTQTHFLSFRAVLPTSLAATRQVLIEWNHQKIRSSPNYASRKGRASYSGRRGDRPRTDHERVRHAIHAK